jgi:4-diphosphocytidyl-2-C-methyl-D-erythritol kinase
MSIYYSISAPAKLNLNLFVKDKNLKGIHFLQSDICFLELKDKIYIKFSEKDIFRQCNDDAFMINPNNNLILDAIKKFRSFTNWNKNFEIYLDKKIPIGAGLGGGSADAAATLIILRKLFNKEKNFNHISFSNILEIGSQLGSDIPACLLSKDLKLNGYGREIRRKKFPNNFYFLIINPNIVLSTKDVFDNYSNFENLRIGSNVEFFENIKIYNSLLFSAISLAPEIKDVLDNLKRIRNIVAYGMTGSGSTCFGIFKSLKDIPNLSKFYNNNYFIWFGQKANYKLNRVCFSKFVENKF